MNGTIIYFDKVATTAPYQHDSSQDNVLQAVIPTDKTYKYSSEISGSATDTQPINEYPHTSSGSIIPFFMGDYYYRVHVIPNRIDIGNLVSEQTRHIEVWNAFLREERLSSVDKSGLDGITENITAGTFAPLESRDFEIVVSTKGVPVIDAEISLHFTETYTFAITGKRVVVWGFMPLVDYKESLEWLTDILVTRKSEQRFSLRQAPRQSFEYRHVLTAEEFSKAKTLLHEWRHRVFGVPVWCEMTAIGRINQGTTEIAIDTKTGDYRDNDSILLWDDSEHLEAITTDSITDNKIILKNPVAFDYQNAYVMPLRFGVMTENSFNRPLGAYAMTSVDFLITDNINIGHSNRQQYLGDDVVTECCLIGVSDSIIRDVWTSDNNVSHINQLAINDVARHKSQMRWFCKTGKDLFVLRQWLHSRAGRFKPFWLSSSNDDIQLLDVVNSTSSIMRVKSTHRELFGHTSHFVMYLKNGQELYGHFIGSNKNDDGSENLHLKTPLGIEISPDDIEKISYLELVRLDSDRIEIEHFDKNMAKVTVPTITVLER
ncbi:MAG: hypothetical protein KGV56_05070 [Gammaproteobacteria bacterium]|nr:hypothetical protein [Gammaproteobacteria bacterium]